MSISAHSRPFTRDELRNSRRSDLHTTELLTAVPPTTGEVKCSSAEGGWVHLLCTRYLIRLVSGAAWADGGSGAVAASDYACGASSFLLTSRALPRSWRDAYHLSGPYLLGLTLHAMSACHIYFGMRELRAQIFILQGKADLQQGRANGTRQDYACVYTLITLRAPNGLGGGCAHL